MLKLDRPVSLILARNNNRVAVRCRSTNRWSRTGGLRPFRSVDLEPFNSSNDITVMCDVTITEDVTSPFFARFIVSPLQHRQWQLHLHAKPTSCSISLLSVRLSVCLSHELCQSKQPSFLLCYQTVFTTLLQNCKHNESINQSMYLYFEILMHPSHISYKLEWQLAQLSQRDRAAGWVSNGQKRKTGTERHYLRTI